MTREELRELLEPFVADCLSDDAQTAREALHAYLDYIISYISFNAELPENTLDPLHRVMMALADANHGDFVRLFAPVPRGANRPRLHMGLVYASAAAMVTVLNRDHGKDLQTAAKQAVKFICDLGFKPPRARRDAGESRTDAERLLAIRKKCSANGATPEWTVRNEYRLMCESNLTFVEHSLRELRRRQP